MLPSSLQPPREPAGTCCSAQRLPQRGVDDGDLVHHAQQLIRAPAKEATAAATDCPPASGATPPPPAAGATFSHRPVGPRKPVAWHSSTKTRAPYREARRQISCRGAMSPSMEKAPSVATRRSRCFCRGGMSRWQVVALPFGLPGALTPPCPAPSTEVGTQAPPHWSPHLFLSEPSSPLQGPSGWTLSPGQGGSLTVLCKVPEGRLGLGPAAPPPTCT